MAGLTAQAQDAIPVMDIQLQNELESQGNHHMRQWVNLMLIKGNNRQAQEAVEETRSLQEAYRHFLRQTTSTVNLSWMDMQHTVEQLEWVTAADGHLDDYGFSKQLAQIHAANMEPSQKSQLLYEWLIPFDETRALTSLEALRADQRQRQLHQEALRQMQQRRQIQLARLEQINAASSQQESRQLANLLLTSSYFSMAEAERLTLLGKTEDGFLQSQKAQLRADEFMHQSSNYGFSKAYMLNRYHQHHLRQSVGSTNLFQR